MGPQRREMTAVLGGETTSLLNAPRTAAAEAAAAADAPEDPFSRAFETGRGRGGSPATVERAEDGAGGEPKRYYSSIPGSMCLACWHLSSRLLFTRYCRLLCS